MSIKNKTIITILYSYSLVYLFVTVSYGPEYLPKTEYNNKCNTKAKLIRREYLQYSYIGEIHGGSQKESSKR